MFDPNPSSRIEELYKLFESYPTVVTDSRRVITNSIYFALKGVFFDGNKFADAALRSGAAYAVVDDASLVEESPCLSSKYFLVDDVLTAMQELAHLHRQRLNIPILAITGSNGKTTTKELTAAVLSRKYRVVATVGNLNNHIGVPLTLLSMNHNTEFGVVEMGANAQGEIELLSAIAAPNFGIINNIGRAHLEGFGGVEGIKRGKGELLDYLAQRGDGVAFVAEDDVVLVEMAEGRPTLKKELYSFGLASGMKHQLEGDFNLKNIAAAVAIGRYFGVEEGDIESAIASYIPQNNRSQRKETQRNTLIMDCYNANPSSMELSISNFLKESFEPYDKKSMILGDMFELGEWSAEEHLRVVRQATSVADVELFLVGHNFAEVAPRVDTTERAVHFFASRDELLEYLSSNPISSHTILIKGSRGVGLEVVAEHL
ncbi:MAG: UDP-N-acetylmuramoyl-tripeptide--D-alanyl-D-alanine ligase [Rikenellaceae bacterium]